MDVTGFGLAPRANVDEFARHLHAPSRLRHISESSSRLSQYAPSTLERASTGKESIEPLDVRSPSGDRAKDPRALDVDAFRRWWRQRVIQEVAEKRSHRRIPTGVAITLAGIALIGSALALKGGAPTLLKRSTIVAPANDTAKVQNLGGETAGTPADISTMTPAGLSGSTPVAPEVDAQGRDGQPITEPEFVRSVPAGAEGSRFAWQVSSSAEHAKPPPASEPVDGAVGATQPSFNLPAKHSEAAIASAAADTQNALLRPGTASGAKALQHLVESVSASASPAEDAAAGSTGWVVQLGARSSEADAKRDLKRLNTKYGSALKGSTVGFRKGLVKGETVYRLHVDGLSRDEAAAL
jgi:hypothetical protein